MNPMAPLEEAVPSPLPAFGIWAFVSALYRNTLSLSIAGDLGVVVGQGAVKEARL